MASFAKNQIVSLLTDKLGAYLDGLNSTNVKLTTTDAILQMENVSFKEDALTKLKLPIKIKHGLVRKLDLKVPWYYIASSPVLITFEGIDLLLTPQQSTSWEFQDIYSPDYLQAELQALIQKMIAEQQSENQTQQSYFDNFKLKILDNIKVKITDVHIRVEQFLEPTSRSKLFKQDVKQTSFGILLKSFNIHTTDSEGKEIFHDRTAVKMQHQNMFKKIQLDGIAVYLNPNESTMIHMLPKNVFSDKAQVTEHLKQVISSYTLLVNRKEDDETRILDDPNLIYILRPLSLRVFLERKTEKPENLKIDITLDQYSLQFLYSQLKAISQFSRLGRKYRVKLSEQTKAKQYRFLRLPNMNAKEKWKFAGDCIKRSIRTKNGALTAFKIPQTKIDKLAWRFKPLLQDFCNADDTNRTKIVTQMWSQNDQIHFWHTLSALPQSQIAEWIKDVIKTQAKSKEKQQQDASQNSWGSWMYGMMYTSKKQETKDASDDSDQFEDAVEELPALQPNDTTRERTSLEVKFTVKDLTLVLARLNGHNKLDGIQMYNRGALIELRATTLNLDIFTLNVTFQESGVNLITMDRTTMQYSDCRSTIQQNKQLVQNFTGQDLSRPQLTIEIRKGEKQLVEQDIEYDINVQICSIVYKHYEDLVIRAKAISSVKFDEDIQNDAIDQFEQLRETTQNRLYELMYQKKNRFVIHMESPVIILPINNTYEGKNASVWVIRTGNLLVSSEDLKKESLKAKKAEVLNQMTSPRNNQKRAIVSSDKYEGYRINLTSIGLHYYQSYDIYQKAQSKGLQNQSQTGVYAGQQLPVMPARFHQFTIEQNDHLNQEQSTQTMKEFSVLEDFEIRTLLKTMTKKGSEGTKGAKLIIDVETSQIRINLSHSIYNQLINFSHILKISKEKQEEFAQDEENYQLQVKEEVQQNSVCEGLVRKHSEQSGPVVWEENYAMLSGRYIYFYKDKLSTAYIEYLDIKGAEMLVSGQQITIGQPGQNKITFLVRDGNTSWESKITQQILIFTHSSPEDIELQVSKRKTELKRKAQESQDKDQVSIKVDCQVPSLKIQILRMILMPGTKIIQQPIAFENWVTIAFLGMKLGQVTRPFDQELNLRFKQITLSDCTMPIIHQTLMCQTVQTELFSVKQEEQHSLQIIIRSQKQESPKFFGLLSDIDITLINVKFKFMPGTINQLIKLLRSTRLQTKPQNFTDEEEQYEQLQFLESSNSNEKLIPSTNSSQIDQNDSIRMTMALSPEQAMLLQSTESTSKVVEKHYESTCLENKTQTSRIRVKVTNIQMSMLHHKYTMELYSLDANSMNIEMSDWYDHSMFEVSMSNLKLCDLTNYPYTYSPKAFFATVKNNEKPLKVTPNELIACGEFKMCLQSFQSPNCADKLPNFNNKIVMKISPFKINFVQEVTMRFIEYFQQRFIDSLTMTDPYKNPKEEFEARQKRSGIPIEKINNKTDFKQPMEVDFMDIQVVKAEIFARDRPFSQNYILISSPLIKVSSERVLANERLPKKPEIVVGMQRFKVELQKINFFYGISKRRKDRLSLLKQTFGVRINYDALQYSELIEKIDNKLMDKSANIKIDIDPWMLVLPQAVYTYILRCSDLNFAWTDRLQEEFYCIKWIHMTDHYKQLKSVVSQRINITVPLLSLTLKHTDGSFIAELLLRSFNFNIIKYMDGASDYKILCQKFFILDQQNYVKSKKKQAIVCPWDSALIIDPSQQAGPLSEEERFEESQLKVKIQMKPSGEKEFEVGISGLKIFLKMPLFILMQGFFINAFPKYNSNDIDKPVGFVGNDPDNNSRMLMRIKVQRSLICLLNQPGFKSIACQGDIDLETRQESIKEIKSAFNSLELSGDQSQITQTVAMADESNQSVYQMKLTVNQLTPYICSLSHLESGEVDFSQINKRQLFSPLDLSLDQTYYLTPVTDDDYQETGKFGVTSKTSIKIGNLQLRLSILDLHLILQVTAYASEQMAKETVYRLQEIEKSIDQDIIQKLHNDDVIDAPIKKKDIANPDSFPESKKKEFFENLIVKFQESNNDSMATVMERLSQTTNQFKKVANGYTGQSYNERETFLEFIKKDILQNTEDDDMPNVKDEIPYSKPLSFSKIPIPIKESTEGEESESEDEEQKDFFHRTEDQSSYNTLVQSERKKSMYYGFKQIQAAASKESTPSTPLQQQSSSSVSVVKFGKKVLPSQSSSVLTPKSQKSKGSHQSDGDDDFHSARGSFESYNDAVEQHLETFYSFHEKRNAPNVQTNDDLPPFANKGDYDVVKAQKIAFETIRETGAEERQSQYGDSSDEDEEEEEELSDKENQQLKMNQNFQREASVVLQSTMSNVLEDIKDMVFENISILTINDYNCGFTPVLQFEFQNISLNQNWMANNTTTQNLIMQSIIINYYNIELGEWEPLLEPTNMLLDQKTTTYDHSMNIEFKKPINLNSTEECLRNLFYSYESWMQTPQFFQKPPDKKKKSNQQVNSLLDDIRTQNKNDKSVNQSDSDEDDEIDGVYKGPNNNNKVFLNQMRESIVGERPSAFAQSEKYTRTKLLYNQSHISEEPFEDNGSEAGGISPVRIINKPLGSKTNNQQLVTPFSIANYTSRTIKIVRGGIRDLNQVRNHQQNLSESGTQNQKIYVLAPSMQTDYAVTYGRLMGNQKNTKDRNSLPAMSVLSSEDQSVLERDEPTSPARTTLNDNEQKSLQKLKNIEMIGIQLSELDYVPKVDLNRNTGQNPWVHEISSTIEQSQNTQKQYGNLEDNEMPLLLKQESGSQIHINTNELPMDFISQNKNKVFYGTLLKGMRKFLIVRAPICIVNKTSFQYEVRILDHATKTEKSKFKIPQGESMGLDDNFFTSHQLSVRQIKRENDGVDDQQGWSERVQISTLLKLPLDQGTGVFLSNKEAATFTTCIKRQSGEINGTTDLVLLPPVTIKNCLPANVLVRQRFKQTNGSIVHNSAAIFMNHHSIEQSQEKQFHVFSVEKNKDQHQFELELGVSGFIWKEYDLKVQNNLAIETFEDEFEIRDEEGNTLRIGLRNEYTKAGFHLILYAHVCLLLEPVIALPNMKFFYNSRFYQQQPLANYAEIKDKKYIMCNKDSDIVVGMRNQNQDQFTMSQAIELKEVGKETQFHVLTALPDQVRYDFVCKSNMEVADYESKIFTKVVLITPKYIICNNTKANIEVAQFEVKNFDSSEVQRILEPGEKREWYWSAGNMPEDDLKIVIRKPEKQNKYRAEMLIKDEIEHSFGNKDTNNEADLYKRRSTESDKVDHWNWSKPFSLEKKDFTSFPIMLGEKQGSRKKILLISKKVVGSTTFIIIREETKSIQPTYLIKNNCPNVRMQFYQDGQDHQSIWKLKEMQLMAYAHVDPQMDNPYVIFNLKIDKSVSKRHFDDAACFDQQIRISMDQVMREPIEINYLDVQNNDKVIEIKLSNDGLTSTLNFRLVGESNLKRQQVTQQVEKAKLNASTLKRTTMSLQISTLSISVIGYTTVDINQSFMKTKYQTLRERNEIALITISDLTFINVTDLTTNQIKTNMDIVKIQVDNQSSQNPLFHTILQKKDTSNNTVPFICFVFHRQFNEEKNLTTVNFFQLTFAEYVLKIDDYFMINITNAFSTLSELSYSNKSNVHPLFMKDSFYEKDGYLDHYVKNLNYQSDGEITSSQKDNFMKKQINLKRRATIKQQPIGIITVSEARFSQNIEDIPVASRHWMLQNKSLEDSAKLKLDQFIISKIVIELSLIFRTKNKNQNSGMLSRLPGNAMKFASVDQFRLSLTSFKSEERYVGQQELINEIYNLYGSSWLKQALKLTASFRMLGSIFINFGIMFDGFNDLIEIPRNGFNRSWQQGLLGLVQGFGSCGKKFFVGFFGWSQTFGESWSEIALMISFDKEYAIKHEEEVITEKPKNFVEGLGFGANAALKTIPDAIFGVIARPIVETYRGGYRGLAFGFLQAFMGLLFKPVSGAFDLMAKTSEGFKNTFKILEQRQKKGRVRMPRTFYGIQRHIKIFSEDDAFIVSNVLCQIKRGEFAQDHYIDMKLIRTANDNRAPHFLLLSEENLFLIEASQKALVWHVEHKNIINVQNMNNGLLIHLKEDEDYAGRAQVGLPLDGASSEEINYWFRELILDDKTRKRY